MFSQCGRLKISVNFLQFHSRHTCIEHIGSSRCLQITLLRYLQTASSKSPQIRLSPPLERDNNSVFNISQFDVEQEYKTSRLSYRLRHLEQRTKVNHLLQAVFHNDVAKCHSILHTLSTRIGMVESIININVYLSCLSVLFLKLKSDGFHTTYNVFDLKPIIDDFLHFNNTYTTKYSTRKIDGNSGLYTEAEPSSEISPHEINQSIVTLKSNILYVLCYMYKIVSPSKKSMKSSYSEYIFQLLKKMNVDLVQFSSENINDPQLLPILLELAQSHNCDQSTHESLLRIYKASETENDLGNSSPYETKTSIDPFKNEFGQISYDSLCDYISSTRFDEFDQNSIGKPLYEIYDELSTEADKNDFIEKYESFNKARQLSVESNCLDLYSNLYEKVDNKTNLRKFEQKNLNLVSQWLGQIVDHLEELKQKLGKIDGKQRAIVRDLPEVEQHLLKYMFYLELLPLPALANLIISNLLSQTLATKNGFVGAAQLSRSLSHSFKRLVTKNPSYKPMRSHLNQFYREEDALDFFSTLIKVSLDHCTLPAQIVQAQQYIESKKLIDDVESDDQMFFELIDNDNYAAFRAIQSKQFSKAGKFVRWYAMIKIHPYLFLEYKNSREFFEERSVFLPMLTPPKPWRSPTEGGYLLDLKPIVAKDATFSSLVYLKAAHSSGQLNSTYTSLNVLGLTRWAINGRALEIFNKVLSMDEGFLEIPPKISQLMVNLPKPPLKEQCESEDQYKRLKRRHDRDVSSTVKEFHALKSRRLMYHYIQGLAKAFNANGDVLYLPHNVDTRGRSYPMTSFLNHHNEDCVRALLMFWDAQPLGSKGFDWLKYQLAGLYGQDKLSFEDRVKFVNENMSAIRESARDPFHGNMWWKHGEKPFQSLVLCFEIDTILNFIESNPTNKIEDYRCRIPIHQDGTCNGLQHYAALGGDKVGGSAVNLTPSPSKSDVYVTVLNKVKLLVENDLAHKKTKSIAEIVHPLLDRKMVKRTVMTSVYGVTAYGSMLQVEDRLSDVIKRDELENFKVKMCSKNEVLEEIEIRKMTNKLSGYISAHILTAISSLFASAKLIENWLVGNCHRLITSYDSNLVDKFENFDFLGNSHYKQMMWTSLSGFPVVQQYKHHYDRMIKTPLFYYRVKRPEIAERIDVRKQMNAMAPNFIHSLDATHMMMTAISSFESGISFAAVHDSFWTHPNQVETLSKLIREEFVRLYEADVVAHMKQDMTHTAKGAFQLVWVNKEQNSIFVEELISMRKEKVNPENKAFTKSVLNACLTVELQDPSPVMELYNKYSPDIYTITSTNLATLYDNKVRGKEGAVKVRRKDFVPILVPVVISDSPHTGRLDIKQVLESAYFFS